MPSGSIGVFFGNLTQAQKNEVLFNVKKEAAARFAKYRESIKGAVNLPQVTGQAALDLYRKRAPDVWARLQAQFPQEYNRSMQDWGHLENSMVRRQTQPPPALQEGVNKSNAAMPQLPASGGGQSTTGAI